jgi:hypothetical protein
MPAPALARSTACSLSLQTRPYVLPARSTASSRPGARRACEACTEYALSSLTSSRFHSGSVADLPPLGNPGPFGAYLWSGRRECLALLYLQPHPGGHPRCPRRWRQPRQGRSDSRRACAQCGWGWRCLQLSAVSARYLRSRSSGSPLNWSGRRLSHRLCRTPIELVKVKMQVTLLTCEGLMSAPVSTGGATALSTGQGPRPNFATLPGPLAIIRQTVASHGFRGLWLGQSGTLLRETGGSSAWFTAFEMVSRAFMRQRERERGLATGELGKADLKAWELCVAGAAAGMSYNSERPALALRRCLSQS